MPTKAILQRSTCTQGAPTMLPRRLISSTWLGSRRLWPEPWWPYPSPAAFGINNDDGDGKMEISCNGEGALFVVAQADDLTADDVKKFKPPPELRRLFVPLVEPSSIMLAVQVTFLKYGGVALGTAVHHVAVDALSAFHFFQTWSAFSKHGNRPTVELSCHDRTLLRARSPPAVHPNALSMFYPKHILSNPSRPLAIQVFTISNDWIASLKHLCGGGTSTFCVVSALSCGSAHALRVDSHLILKHT
ncbi:hypothetical protein SORBI_3003G068950 [Sorghum bicolor]|uniref:Uncharacterized protein n=1 Tax=Sorghum bicolor TaxID=4558 RepID=A0A1W0VVZ2_SORBI|nr:hypothetical protein SORBI_3003G068950 [Sorghum bicolor]